MEANFYSITDKMFLIKQLEQGEEDAIKHVINEIQRLESIIKDYEVAFKICSDKVESKTFKTPSVIN